MLGVEVVEVEDAGPLVSAVLALGGGLNLSLEVLEADESIRRSVFEEGLFRGGF